MDKIKGNYVTQANKDFPLDCETLEVLQSNTAMVAALGNIAGDRVILTGCELAEGGARRGEGYVFVRTRECPEGEVLRYEGGAAGSGVTLMTEDVRVSAQGYDYPKAYTRRWLAAGIGTECWKWDEFTRVESAAELRRSIEELRNQLKAETGRLSPSPLGLVELWAGRIVPEGYGLCNGQELEKEAYRDLYKAIGDAFNNGMSAGGGRYTTREGCFRLPDLRGRFVVGQHDSDDDYRNIGAAGGEKKHTLTGGEMPEHTHEMKDYYHAESYTSDAVLSGVDVINGGNTLGSGRSDTKNDRLYYYKHSTGSAGNGEGHENRPPYYVLAYVMKLRIES